MLSVSEISIPVKIVLRGDSRKYQNIGFQDLQSLNAGQKYCGASVEHSAIILACINMIKLPFVIKIFVFSIFERPPIRQVYCILQNIIIEPPLPRVIFYTRLASVH